MGRGDQIAMLADGLAGQSGLKVWSVIATFLGDMAQQDSGRDVAGTTLTPILGRIGINPPAMRTALHRLRQDGWITSRKEGRTSFARLSPEGLAQTGAVSARVFGPGPDAPDGWTIGLCPGSDKPGPTALELTRGVWLFAGAGAALPDGWMRMETDDLDQPDWVAAILRREARVAEFEALSRDLSLIDPKAINDDIDRAALRLLVLHGWRRLILRTHPVAERALGPDSAVARARAQVRALLEALPRMAEVTP